MWSLELASYAVPIRVVVKIMVPFWVLNIIRHLVFRDTCHSINPSIYLLICLFIYLSIYLSISLSLYLSVSPCIYIYLSLCLFACLSTHLSTSIYPSTYTSINLSISPSIHASICLYTPTYLQTYIDIYIYIMCAYIARTHVGLQGRGKDRLPLEACIEDGALAWVKLCFIEKS